MATNLESIITAIKTTALANGFTTVEETALNLNSTADTQLDKLFIKLNGIDYSDLLQGVVTETFKFELIAIIGFTETPLVTLKNKIDVFLNQLFTQNQLFSQLTTKQYVNLTSTNISNDRDIYTQDGGIRATITMDIENTNQINGAIC